MIPQYHESAPRYRRSCLCRGVAFLKELGRVVWSSETRPCHSERSEESFRDELFYRPGAAQVASQWPVAHFNMRTGLPHHLPQNRFDGVCGLGDHFQDVRGGVAHSDGVACHGQQGSVVLIISESHAFGRLDSQMVK